jgi:glycosyltransferase involved in cell wall biosynthesis
VKILKITDAWDFIAEADNLLVMARELKKLGHRVIVACARGTGLETRAPAAGIEVRVVPGMENRKSPFAFLRAASACRALLRELSPDVVHAYRSPPHLMAIWAARGTRTAIVRTRATMVPPRATMMNRKLDSATARTIVSADAVKALCVEAGFSSEKLVVIPGGIDLERFDPAKRDRAAAKKLLGFGSDALVIGHLARLAPIKGHVHLIAAMKEVVREVPQAGLALVGPAVEGMDATVRGWIGQQGLSAHVTITGAVEDPVAALAAFDVGVVSSIGSEAFSRAALEYLAMGLPVVATRVGTLPELVQDGVTGTLVPHSDPGALAAALIDLLRDEAKRRTFGAAALVSATRYDAAAQAKRLDAVYREIVR